MTDIVSKEKRSKMMAGIHGKNTKPEILIRKALHARGLRYKLHDKTLPGKPDIVLPKYRAVIQVHGCFWHLHNCHLFKWPSSRLKFWRDKLYNNKKRDLANIKKLNQNDWRVLIIWECKIKGKYRSPIEEIISEILAWLVSNSKYLELKAENNT